MCCKLLSACVSNEKNGMMQYPLHVKIRKQNFLPSNEDDDLCNVHDLHLVNKAWDNRIKYAIQ